MEENCYESAEVLKLFPRSKTEWKLEPLTEDDHRKVFSLWRDDIKTVQKKQTTFNCHCGFFHIIKINSEESERTSHRKPSYMYFSVLTCKNLTASLWSSTPFLIPRAKWDWVLRQSQTLTYEGTFHHAQTFSHGAHLLSECRQTNFPYKALTL